LATSKLTAIDDETLLKTSSVSKRVKCWQIKHVLLVGKGKFGADLGGNIKFCLVNE
jgi:hypothetical protein